MIKSELKDYGEIVYVTDYIVPKRGSVESAKIVKKPSLKCLFEKFFMSETMILAYPIYFEGNAGTIRQVDMVLDVLHERYPEKSILAYIELRDKGIQTLFCIDGMDTSVLFEVNQMLDTYISKKPLLLSSLKETDEKLSPPGSVLTKLQRRKKNVQKESNCSVRIHTRNMKVFKTFLRFNEEVDHFIRDNNLVDWPYNESFQTFDAIHNIYSKRRLDDVDVPKSFLNGSNSNLIYCGRML